MEAKFYKVYRKWTGKKLRRIEEPEPELKIKQKKILRWLQNYGVRPTSWAHGCVRYRSIATNAKPHVGKAVVLCMDLKDFFSNILEDQVVYSLIEEGVDIPVAKELANICTIKGRLPQGSPTSPFLANLAAKTLDKRLGGLSKKSGVSYTRYVDDITFSSGSVYNISWLIPSIENIIHDEGFKINSKKTRIYRKNRKKVAGVIVTEKLSVPRERRRLLRAQLHNFKRDILQGKAPKVSLEQLQGTVSFIRGIQPDQVKQFQDKLKEVEIISQYLEVACGANCH